MNNDPKEKKYGDQFLGLTEKSEQKSTTASSGTYFNSSTALVFAGVLQIIAGLGIVAVTILGLLNPLWLSVTLSLIGSISCVFGVYLIFHAIATNGNFDSLINQSIKRVIRDQN